MNGLGMLAPAPNLENTCLIPCVRVEGLEANNYSDIVVREDRVSLIVNGVRLISTIMLLEDLEAYCVGFLNNEGIINELGDIFDLRIKDLNIYVQAKINKKNLDNFMTERTLTPGGGIGISANINGENAIKMKPNFNIPMSYIHHCFDIFNSNTPLFNSTGCTHKIMIFSNEELIISQDIGRHNALDKAIGKAMLKGVDTKKSLLISSGRLSNEMVIKAAMANIPIICSKAATTFLAIKSAVKIGITLIAFYRNNACNIYSHVNRVDLNK